MGCTENQEWKWDGYCDCKDNSRWWKMSKKFANQYGKRILQRKRAKLLKKHNINHYSTYSIMKASIIERFNRMLKNDMWKQFTYNGNYKWIDLLSRLVSEYNARKHRTISMRPIDVTSTIVDKLLNTVYRRSVKAVALPRFKVSNSVRVSKFKIFEKEYTPNWTMEVFRIIKENSVTYLLEDYRGKSIAEGFYEYKLHRVANSVI